MISNKQKEKIEKRILATVKLFFENEGKISDEDLARALAIAGYVTSSSTVGRDLVSTKTQELIGDEDYELILKIRKQNKIEGTIKGGTNSISKNNVIKDEHGKFMGCERRKI